MRAHQPLSHAKRGWEHFTDAVINALNTRKKGVCVRARARRREGPTTRAAGLVFLLWGKHAQDKARCISRGNHLVLESPHPSGLSAHRGWFGNHHFSKANAYLAKQGQEPINWQN